MAFTKGTPKPKASGKKKGTRNKKTVVLDQFCKHVAEGGQAKFEREMKKLNGKAYVEAFLRVMEYVQPKLQRTTHVGDKDNPMQVTGFIIQDDSK